MRSAELILTLCQERLAEFDEMNTVTAVHRIAKSRPASWVSRDSRFRSLVGLAGAAAGIY